MANLIVILSMVVCVLLILIVLIQNPKGGGLSSAFGGGGTQSFGVQRTTDFLEKATWGLAIVLFGLCIVGGLVLRSGAVSENSGPSNVEQRLLENPGGAQIIPQPVDPNNLPGIEALPTNPDQ